jgi:hypothetical protein
VKYRNKILVVLGTVVCLFCVQVEAQQLVQRVGKWSVYVSKKGKNRQMCYIVGIPASSTKMEHKRDKTYITVTDFGNGEEEFSFSPSYVIKDKSAYVQVDDKESFGLINEGRLAWALKEMDDKKIINFMMKGSKLVAKAQNTKNKLSEDAFDLSGFTKAVTLMRSKCK